MNTQSISVWFLFNLVVILLLWSDLKLFHRNSAEIPVKSALKLSAFWIGLALCFNLYIYYSLGTEPAFDFFTAYLVEKSLSVDNLFVFLMIFNYFDVPKKFQHRVLYYGIIGALLMRALFIFLGVTLLAYFEELIYVLGAFLIFSGAKLIKVQLAQHAQASKNTASKNIDSENIDSENQGSDNKHEEARLVEFLARLSKKLACEDDDRASFFRRINGSLRPTKIFFVIIAIELCDVVFALDSIPAVLAISSDPFIVYTSNVCAILGLRALFFALAGLMTMFRYLDHGLAIILMFVGAKMVLKSVLHIPSWLSLVCIVGILTSAIVLSMLRVREEEENTN